MPQECVWFNLFYGENDIKQNCFAVLFYYRKLVAGEEMYTTVAELLDALSLCESSDNKDKDGELNASVKVPSIPATSAVEEPGIPHFF